MRKVPLCRVYLFRPLRRASSTAQYPSEDGAILALERPKGGRQGRGFVPISPVSAQKQRVSRKGSRKKRGAGVEGSNEDDERQQEAQKDALETALEVEWWPIERPLPYEHNPRVVPDIAIEKVATSIIEYGWRQPLVVDEEGVLIVGHTRLLAAKKLGLSKVPVHVARGLSPEKVKAYRLMDNRSNEETSWNFSLLEAELAELVGMNLDPLLTGFSPEELTALLNPPSPGLTDPDEIVEPPAVPETRPGDLWTLWPPSPDVRRCDQ